MHIPGPSDEPICASKDDTRDKARRTLIQSSSDYRQPTRKAIIDIKDSIRKQFHDGLNQISALLPHGGVPDPDPQPALEAEMNESDIEAEEEAPARVREIHSDFFCYTSLPLTQARREILQIVATVFGLPKDFDANKTGL